MEAPGDEEAVSLLEQTDEQARSEPVTRTGSNRADEKDGTLRLGRGNELHIHYHPLATRLQ